MASSPSSSSSAKRRRLESTSDADADTTSSITTVVSHGLRWVMPYWFTFKCGVKPRWRGRGLVDAMAMEFPDLGSTYFSEACKRGRLKMLDKTSSEAAVDGDVKLIMGRQIAHKRHRHEDPVLAQPLPTVIDVVKITTTPVTTNDDSSIVVDISEIFGVDKPASMPVHPCGRYRHNTLLQYVNSELNLPYARAVNRLDRLTSGLVIFGKSSLTASHLCKDIADRKMKKEYLCIVRGEFPIDTITVSEPVRIVFPTHGISAVDRILGKEAETTFERLDYDASSGTSLVRALPTTGRTHQIRVHLLWLGHPIANDPVYTHPAWSSVPVGKVIDPVDLKRICVDVAANRPDEGSNIDDSNEEIVTGSYPLPYDTDDLCKECTNATTIPSISSLSIWLHAFRYSGLGWSLETSLPVWAHNRTGSNNQIRTSSL